MRGSAIRVERYEKKVRGLVLPGQTERYAPTAQDRIHLEYCVKREAITPMLQFSYVAYLEELLKHEASKRPVEAQGIFNKWLNRGLDSATLISVADCIGVTIPPPVPPCSSYTTQEECEAAECYWWDDECHDEPAPPVCDWAFKMKLTFSGNVSATDLDNFPVLIHLTNANFDFTHAKANGEDIRFMDADLCPTDGTPLKHEIEHWDQAGQEAWVWVKVPRIDGGSVIDFIYMYFDNPAAADGQDVPGTWNGNHMMVQHMYDDPDNQHVTDSTANNNDGTKVAPGAPAEQDARIYKGQYGDGVDDHIVVNDAPTLDGFSGIAVSFWMKSDDVTQVGEGLVSKDVSGYNRSWEVYLAAGGVIRFLVEDAGGDVGYSTGTTDVTDDQWHLITCVWDTAGPCDIYVDGVLDTAVYNDVSVTNPLRNGTSPVWIGGYWSTAYVFKGWLDEVRISDVKRTADWIRAQHLSMTDALITYGAEEGT